MSRKLIILATLMVLMTLPMAVKAAGIKFDPEASRSGEKKCGMPGFNEEKMMMLDLKNAGMLPEQKMAPEWGPRAAPVLGTTYSFHVVDNDVWDVVYAKHVKTTAEAYIYVQTVDSGGYTVFEGSGGIGAGYITQTDADLIATEFSSVYSTTRSVFGSEPATGLDGDSHVTILLLDIDSDYPRYADSGIWWWQASWTAGYFYSIDTYSEATAQGYGLHSNERKIIYIDTYPTMEHGYADLGASLIYPDPTKSHDNDEGGTFLNEGADASYPTIAHELQHMIHFNQDADEEVWLNEGCSGFAEFANGYGVPDSVGSYVANSDDSLINWSGTIADYGSSFLFTMYLYEQVGAGSLNSTITSLVADSANGTTSVTNALGGSITLSAFFKNWLLANYLDDKTIDSKYGYTNVTMSSYSSAIVGDDTTRDGIDPWVPIDPVSGSGSVEAMAAEYYIIDYPDKNVINFIGAGFEPMVIGYNGTTPVSGSIENLATNSDVTLANFGGTDASSYQRLILVAANASASSSAFSYEIKGSGGGGGGGGGGCFIAETSYKKDAPGSFIDKVIELIRDVAEEL